MKIKKNTNYVVYTAFFGNIIEPHGCTVAPQGDVISLTMDDKGDVYGIIFGQVPKKDIIYRVVKYPLIKDNAINIQASENVEIECKGKFMYEDELYLIFIGEMKDAPNIKGQPIISKNKSILTFIKIYNIFGIIGAIIATLLGQWFIGVSIICALALSTYIITKLETK